MDGIPINKEIIDRFKSNEFSDHTTEESSSLVGLNEAASWLLRSLDKLARNKDHRLGTDKETIELYSELSVIVARRNISEDVLRNSPEIFLGTITAGILIEKALILSTIKKEKKSEPEKPESE